MTSNATIDALFSLFSSLPVRAQKKFLSKISDAQPKPPAPKVDYRTMTVRHGLRHYLQSNGPAYYRDLPEILGCQLTTVRNVLSSCPEFVSDKKGQWTIGRY